MQKYFAGCAFGFVGFQVSMVRIDPFLLLLIEINYFESLNVFSIFFQKDKNYQSIHILIQT
jgi:hypothetical protein